ncbi:MAG: ribosome-associated translation inhibitor RaiA [Candidatus Moranbacteria bacterium]|nr:ribosome-associated translation inhibitor RaiA [Candidatus Moranbacteria bacterium]
MNTTFLAKDTHIRENSKEYILKRLGEIEDFFHGDTLFEIEVGEDKKGFFRVEVNVREPNKLYRAEETSESVEGSIDMVIDKLRVQIVREKDRRRDLHDRGARSIKKKIVLDEAARF